MSKELIEALDGTIALLEREALLTQFEVVRERRRSCAALLQAHRDAIAAGPVAYGFGNTAITGKPHRLMMVRLDIPSDDQYGGALWEPLYVLEKQQ